MIIVDNALQQRADENRPIRVGMIGAGFMGRGIALQMANFVKGMKLVAIANRGRSTFYDSAYRTVLSSSLKPVGLCRDADRSSRPVCAGAPPTVLPSG